MNEIHQEIQEKRIEMDRAMELLCITTCEVRNRMLDLEVDACDLACAKELEELLSKYDTTTTNNK